MVLMLNKRFTIFLCIFAFGCSNVSAQLVHHSISVSHVTDESPLGTLARLDPKGGVHDPNHTMGALPFAVFPLSTNRHLVSDNITHPFVDSIVNLSQSTDTIYFFRSQQLPACWNTSVCWGSTCYASSVDSQSYPIPPGGYAILTLDANASLNDVSDSTTLWLRVGVAGSPADTMLFPFYISFVPPDPPLVFQWSGLRSESAQFDTTFVGIGSHTLSNFLANESCNDIGYNFTVHDSLPSGWTLTTCLQGTKTTCTSADTLLTNFDAFGGSNYLQKVKFTVDAPQVTTKDSAIIYFGVYPVTGNPADSAVYRFAIAIAPSSGVSSQEEHEGLVVSDAWPNPVHLASLMHLTVLAAQPGPVTAGIYGIDGLLKSTLEFGPLNAGSNDLQFLMPGLPSGEYIVRIQRGSDAPQTVRINYIK
jgi:hypothetical protein